MKRNKWIVTAALFAVLMLVVSGCATNQAEKIEPQTLKVAALSGPTGMGMAPMIANGVDLGEGVKTEFTVATAPDQITAGIINGEYQIAAVPTNLAAVLYNKTEGAVILGAVNTMGTLSIVADKSEPISGIADLKGKTILATGQGSTPEVVLNYLLKENNLIPNEDVIIEWLPEHAEAAAKLASGEGKIALLPQPFATTALAKNSNLQLAVDITEAWSQATDGIQLEMGCVIVNKDWADKNQALVKKFMEEYEKSVTTINKADEQAGELIAEAGIIENAKMAQKAIPNCGITFIPVAEAEADLQPYYEILADFEPKSVGGKVPGEEFYKLAY